MLSTMNGMHPRQRQHRRQNSTPTAFQGVNIPTLSIQQQRQAASHRRGLSLDIRRQQQHPASPTAGQDFMVSTGTNITGLANNSQHRVLREAQQQRTQARPGSHTSYATLAPSGGESYLISPHGTPQTQRFDPSCFDANAIPFDPYTGELNIMMGRAQPTMGDNMTGSREYDLFNTDSSLSTPTFANFQDSPTGPGWTSEGETSSTRRSSRRISNGIMDRVAKYENMGLESIERPITPPNQNAHNYYPPTPMETPHQQSGRFSDGYDESMEETIRPSRNQPNRRAQDVFQAMRQHAQEQIPNTPSTNPLPNTETFANFQMQNPSYMAMSNFQDESVMKPQLGRSQSEPSAQDMPPVSTQSSGNQRTMLPQWPNDQQTAQVMASQQPLPSAAQTPQASSQAPVNRHRRNESTVSNASEISFGGLNIDETRTETGITLDQITEHMQGPDSGDGKWTCTFDGCGKRFGRKENIKSHVQTHLNDRQFQCPSCMKCFVRQHDLKRHAKIHTGVKNYLCPCGNSFARHDALTRHRQRGMCIGAFDGVVRKVARRGRPPKNRPDMEARKEKAARTRRKNMSISSVSSQSEYSDFSEANSPENDFYMVDGIVDIELSSPSQLSMGMSSHAPMVPVSSAPMPSASMSMPASSPTGSVHSYVSPEAIMEHLNSHPPTPGSMVSHFTTPGLSQASSPPPSQFFDLDPSTTCINDPSDILSSSSLGDGIPLDLNDDDDILRQFTELDRDTSSISMTKFDEQFNALIEDTDGDFLDTTPV